MAEYLRLSTLDLSLLNIDGDEERNQQEDDIAIHTSLSDSISQCLKVGAPLDSPPPPSLTSNVKKPVRRKSLDGSATTTNTILLTS